MNTNYDSYKGLYVQRSSNGDIHTVQVVSGNISIPLDPQEYIDRNIKPDINTLPDEKNYQ